MTEPLQRADKLIVEMGLVSSRVLAQKLIDEGKVTYWSDQGRVAIPKASFKLTAADQIQVEDSDLTKYVSRGGLKLEGALQHGQISVLGKSVLDIGQSTGGFTDCVLQLGAKQVVGVDVGQDQLHQTLRDNPLVTCLENINARALPTKQLLEYAPSGYDLIIMDVSFISQTLILPGLRELLSDTGKIVSLVKPQFEVGKDGLGKNGIVRDQEQYRVAETRIRNCCTENNLTINDFFDSPIKGGDGNKEFFIIASK